FTDARGGCVTCAWASFTRHRPSRSTGTHHVPAQTRRQTIHQSQTTPLSHSAGAPRARPLPGTAWRGWQANGDQIAAGRVGARCSPPGLAWSTSSPMGAKGLSAGVKLANAARCAQGEAAETVSRQAMTMGLDVFHTQRELERVLQRQWKHAERQLDTASQADAKVERYRRQGREPAGGSGAAGRAWHKAERLFDQAVHAQEAVQQIAAALSWFDAKGRLYCRQTAQAQLDAACQQLQGDCWRKVKRLLSDERTLNHLDQLHAHLTAAVSDSVVRDALTRLWYIHDQIRQAQDDTCLHLRHLVVIEQVLCERLCPQWQSAYRRVDELLRYAVRASSAVE